MKIWLDAQIPPSLAGWLSTRFKVQVVPVRDLGLLFASDAEIFTAARREKAIVMSKDIDFVKMIEDKGIPPHLIWLTCGNISNSSLRQKLDVTFADALRLIESGEDIVEIGDV
jgi:predicted nuclease of predicted toxin-antitoxin system